MKSFGSTLLLVAGTALLSTIALGPSAVAGPIQSAVPMWDRPPLPTDAVDTGMPASTVADFGDIAEMPLFIMFALPFDQDVTAFFASEGGVEEDLLAPPEVFALVTATPEPGSLPLLATSLAGLASIAWRLSPRSARLHARRSTPRSAHRYVR
jgi:hypothetical protein